MSSVAGHVSRRLWLSGRPLAEIEVRGANIPLVPALVFTLATGDLAAKIAVWVLCGFAGVLVKGFVIPVVRANVKITLSHTLSHKVSGMGGPVGLPELNNRR